jgi:hypothetical protein
VLPAHEDQGAVPIVHSGTASSSRGRAAEKGKNSVNVLRIDEKVIEVMPLWFESDATGFVARESIQIRRS